MDPFGLNLDDFTISTIPHTPPIMPQDANIERWMALAGLFISTDMIHTGNTAVNRENLFTYYNKEHEKMGDPTS